MNSGEGGMIMGSVRGGKVGESERLTRGYLPAFTGVVSTAHAFDDDIDQGGFDRRWGMMGAGEDGEWGELGESLEGRRREDGSGLLLDR